MEVITRASIEVQIIMAIGALSAIIVFVAAIHLWYGRSISGTEPRVTIAIVRPPNNLVRHPFQTTPTSNILIAPADRRAISIQGE
jgi:hypothetical protein